MTDGPASEPPPPGAQPGPAPQPWAGQPTPAPGQPMPQQYPGYPPAQPPMAPHYPGYAQPWPAPAPANGVWLGVAALVLGLLGCVVPLLPVDLTGIREYLAFPFGVAGLVCGIVGLVGRRTAKPLSAVGVAVSAIALVLGVMMLGNVVAG